MHRAAAWWLPGCVAASVLVSDAAVSRAGELNDAQRAELRASIADAKRVEMHGPATIPLLDEATLRLPAWADYIPEPQASRFMRAIGNVPGSHELGLVLPADKQAAWFAQIVFARAGYVRDDDGSTLDPDAILASLRRSTDAANGDRAAHGYPEFEVTGWLQTPAYDKATHHLIWSALVRTKGEATDPGSANYNTRILGRDGVLSLDLVAAPDRVVALKPEADALASAIVYDPGKRYRDFSPGSDRVAAYGLAGLIGVVAAKKIGLIALGVVFFAKFAKVIALAAVGMLAAGRRLFGRRSARR